MTYQPIKRYHRLDGWRGYPVPATAIIGGSFTGDEPGSPAKGGPLAAEISRFRKEVLRPNGIHSRGVWGETSNVFCAKRWLCVSKEDFPRAAELAAQWLEANDRDLSVLHGADLDKAKQGV